jgi:hypothetical protein
MPKQKPTQKAVQMEMFPSDKSRQALSSYEAAKINFQTQWSIQIKVYRKILEQLASGGQTISELKQLTDAQRNAATTMKMLIESLQSTESMANESILANDYAGAELADMDDDELRDFFGW